MIETTLYGLSTAGLIGAIAGLYYKIGKLEQKMNLLYDNIDVVIKWAKSNDKKGG